MLLHHENQLGTPETHSPFPLESDVLDRVLRNYSGVNDQELKFISGTNIELLDEDDPIRYLLELKGRPEISIFGSEPVKHAYRAGVCVGAALVRNSVALLEEQGLHSNRGRFDPNADVTLPKLRPKREIEIDTDDNSWNGITSRRILKQNLFPYLEDVKLVDTLDRLKYEWMGEEHDFLTAEEIERGSDDYIFAGLIDVLALNAQVYGYETKSRLQRAKKIGGPVVRAFRFAKSIASRIIEPTKYIPNPISNNDKKPSELDNSK